jgi:hypothetical protein
MGRCVEDDLRSIKSEELFHPLSVPYICDERGNRYLGMPLLQLPIDIKERELRSLYK